MIHVVPESLPRLMIADDDPAVQLLLDASLSRGFDVIGLASDGAEAEALAEACQPDVAVVDVEMAAGDGLRTVRGIHKVAPETAIVVLSVDESGGVVHELMRAGATVYLRKDVAPELLADALIGSIDARANERR